jgi:hypothetical protein
LGWLGTCCRHLIVAAKVVTWGVGRYSSDSASSLNACRLRQQALLSRRGPAIPPSHGPPLRFPRP